MNFTLQVPDIHVFFHHVDNQATTSKLDEILTLLTAVLNQGIIMSAELDALEAEVAANTAVDQSAITLLNGLAAQIIAIKTDPVKLQAFADSLKSSSAALAAAVVANTPAVPGTVNPIP